MAKNRAVRWLHLGRTMIWVVIWRMMTEQEMDLTSLTALKKEYPDLWKKLYHLLIGLADWEILNNAWYIITCHLAPSELLIPLMTEVVNSPQFEVENDATLEEIRKFRTALAKNPRATLLGGLPEDDEPTK